MLRGEGNENGEKTTIGLISKKTTLYVQYTFFCTFLCRCFARLRLRGETSRNFLVTRFMEEMSYMFLFTFSTAAHFFPGWLLAFLIFSPPLQIHVVLPTKNGSLSLALALRRSFSRWASLACCLFSLSFPFSIFHIILWTWQLTYA